MLLSAAIFLLTIFHLCPATIYQPTWKSIDSRPIPQWYDDAKFGIMNTWGVYSAHGLMAWFVDWWKLNKSKEVTDYMKNNYPPSFTYADFGPDFKTELFEPIKFASIIKKSGARYYVLISKHCDGYTLWPSNYSWNWNSMDVGPKRDLVGELKEAFAKLGGVHYGLYFAHQEFFNPLYLDDQAKKLTEQKYIKMVTQPQLQEIVNVYKPDLIWSDATWEAPSSYWNSTNFLAWLYNSSPIKDIVVVNDRWGNGTQGKHGGFYNYADQHDPGVLLAHKWESVMMLNQNWGWSWRHSMRPNDLMSIGEVLALLARTVSCGGNLLLNVGPTGYGTIQAICEERLTQIGDWLAINGEAIYNTKPWIYQKDNFSNFVWYTSKLRSDDEFKKERIFNPQFTDLTIVYAIVTEWPQGGVLNLKYTKPTPQTTVSMIGYQNPIVFKPYMAGIQILLGDIPWKKLPSMYAWVIKLEYLLDEERDPLEMD